MHLKQISVIYLFNFFPHFKQIRKFITVATKNSFILLLSQFMSFHVYDTCHTVVFGLWFCNKL